MNKRDMIANLDTIEGMVSLGLALSGEPKKAIATKIAWTYGKALFAASALTLSLPMLLDGQTALCADRRSDTITQKNMMVATIGSQHTFGPQNDSRPTDVGRPVVATFQIPCEALAYVESKRF